MAKPNDEALSSKRVQTSLLSAPERAALVWMAQRLPAWIGPDLLTAIGLISFAVVGAAYYLAGHGEKRWLWLVVANVGLVLNWFGDSLDGTLARVRNRQRPTYGYYLDHLVDAFGTCFVLFGLTYSGFVTEPLGVAVLTLYLIASINTYLATHTVGVFKISFARLSPTEGRIGLIVMNTVLIFWREATIASRSVKILDIVLGAGGVLLLVLTLRSAIANLTKLDRMERAKWREPSRRRSDS